MFSLSYESLLSGGSLLIVLILMVSNGFFSFPSSQILYITAGVFVASGKLPLIPVLLLGSIGNAIGNFLLFIITKKHGEAVARKFIPLSHDMYKALVKTYKDKSVWWIAIGKLTPSLKVITPVMAGLSKTGTLLTFFIFLITSFIWSVFFVGMGMFFGKSFSFGTYGIVIGAVGVAVALYFMNLVQKTAEKEGAKTSNE